MVLCWPRCLRATDRTRNAGAFCTSASPWSRDQALRLPASERKCHHLAKSAQGGSGIVLFGLMTRMFSYKSQVILSPSGVSWGSKAKAPTLSLSGSDLLSQALELSGWSPGLSPRGCSGRERDTKHRERARPPRHPIPSPDTRDRVSQPEVPAISGRRQTAGSSESFSRTLVITDKAVRELRGDFPEGREMRLSRVRPLTLVTEWVTEGLRLDLKGGNITLMFAILWVGLV